MRRFSLSILFVPFLLLTISCGSTNLSTGVERSPFYSGADEVQDKSSTAYKKPLAEIIQERRVRDF